MKMHRLKILEQFADDVVAGDKLFEIRKNDRGFQKGDCIRFVAVNDITYEEVVHEIYKRRYEITYVLNGWGLKNGYVVLGLREV